MNRWKKLLAALLLACVLVPGAQFARAADAVAAEESYELPRLPAGALEGYYNRYNSSRTYLSSSTYESRILGSLTSSRRQALEAEVQKILSRVSSSWSDLNKALYINDYLASTRCYDLTFTKYSAYDLIVGKTAVCQGYAEAYWLLMTRLGVNCKLVTSFNLNHAWNLVQIGGKWYHVDVTWNDPIEDRPGRARHQYFLLSDTAMRSEENEHNASDWKLSYEGSLSAAGYATSTAYDNAFWSDVDAPLVISGSTYYYVSNAASALVKRTSGGAETVVKSFSGYRWPVLDNPRSHWIGTFSGCGIYNGKLYYNTPTEIRCCKTDGSDDASVYTLPAAESASVNIYSLYIVDNMLYYCLSTDPNTAGAQKSLKLGSSVPVAMKPTVTFHANGGTFGSSTTFSAVVTYGSTYGTLPTPTRTGYIFEGWYTAKSGGSKVTSSTKMTATANHTLYAHWKTAPKITVSFNANGGKASKSSMSVTYGAAYGTLPTATRTGYDFAGWYTAKSGGSKVTSSTKMTATAKLTLYARWTAKTCTLTFNANGGKTSTASRKLTYGAAFGTLPAATRTGYDLKGWYTAKSGGKAVTASTKASGNQTLYAQWKPQTCTLTFNANGGKASTASRKLTYGAAYGTLPKATRTGYDFAGWYTAKSGGKAVTASTKVSGTQTLYARWTAKAIPVTFNANGGKIGKASTASRSYTYGKTYTNLPTPTRDGYTFDGWYTAKSGGKAVKEGAAVTATAKQTLYAHWTAPKKLTVTLNANGGKIGTATTSKLTVTSGGAYGALPTPKRDGYTFSGWYTAKSGGNAVTAKTAVTAKSSHTLYARWTKK